MSSESSTQTRSALDAFSPVAAQWFHSAFATPTPAQVGAWRSIAAGQHTLAIAPTGSGKTLAAFLWALDRLATEPAPTVPQHRCRVLYISPIKALAIDVDRNLRSPLAGMRQAAQRLGLPVPDITVGIRTGDTPPQQRHRFARIPPDILVTTPESLFLLLTSAARESLRGVRTVIVDEIHAVVGTKRGAHLAVSLERLDELVPAPAQRIGLSATVRPVDEIATFLAGGRHVNVVAPPLTKTIEVSVEVPVPDLAALDTAHVTDGEDDHVVGSAAGAAPRASIWPAVERRILDLVTAHRSTIVFTNSRRLCERLTARLNELAAEVSTPAEAATSTAEVSAPAEAGEGPAATPESVLNSPGSHAAFPAEAIGQSGATTGAIATVAKAHHGSMSKEQRSLVEEELKAGELPCVVATSSLELGIDMGAVELVIQVEAPPSVASGLQRIGRGGHQVGAVSRGVMFPKYRGDLISCAVLAERMAAGAIEELRYPRNPLDVLAQQIVATLAMQPYSVTELADLIRRAAPFVALPDSALSAVLDMLSGRYPSEEFGELRPRITWDRGTDTLVGRPGAQRLAVTSGGTIPDRGLFLVTTPGVTTPGASTSGSRVGELDEEMVYESRVGDKILLGTSSWQIEDITHDRVIVTPAPGQPARMPFWKGDAPGRGVELGRAIGAFTRELGDDGAESARRRLSDAGLDEWAADNLLAYLAEQREATGRLPSDRTIVVERFRDELGDWRIVLHSPFGARVNGPWGLLIAAKLREQLGVQVFAVSADDGIVLRIPDALDESGAEILPEVADLVCEPDEVEQLVLAELGHSALFAARFRECAARSLLLPRRDPGRRSPLWQQRQRAAQLLTVASKYEQFPVLLETMRECAVDVYDTAGLAALMTELASQRVRIVEVTTPAPSPFARSLLFGYVGMFLYESDTPLAERRAAALSLDTTLLAELLGSEAISELLDPDVLAELEAVLQRIAPDRRARDVESTADLLRFLGDLTSEEAAQRGMSLRWLTELEQSRRVLTVRIAGQQRWIAVEDTGKVRDALGVALPPGIPDAFTEPVAAPLEDLLARYARTHGPFTAAEVAQRWGIGVTVTSGALERMRAAGRLVRGQLRPSDRAPSNGAVSNGVASNGAVTAKAGYDSGTQYCDVEVLRRLRRGSLARLRAEVEPVEQATLGRFLPAWHGIGRNESAPVGVDELLDVVEQLAGAPIVASALESLVLPSRLAGYRPALLDELTAAGEVRWVGCGALAGNDGWIALVPADLAETVLFTPDAEAITTPAHRAIYAALEDGALFFRELLHRSNSLLAETAKSADSERAPEPACDEATALAALWDLLWAGLISNDTLAPLRTRLSGSHGSGSNATHQTRRVPRARYGRLRGSRPTSAMRIGPPSAAGRWSRLPPPETDPTLRSHARAHALLQRHGVLTRGALTIERGEGGFAGVYRVLRAMEEAGQCRRGYVVEGLGAAQFAVPGAIDQLRSFAAERDAPDSSSDRNAVLLAATDPAQPYGAALAWPAALGDGKHRPGRKAGAVVVLVDGVPALYAERGGRSLLTFTTDQSQLRAAAQRLAMAVHHGGLGSLSVERVNGESTHKNSANKDAAHHGALSSALAEAGFRITPKGLRLRA